MNIHFCFLDKECTEALGEIQWRIYFNDFFGWNAILALHPRWKTQSWNPKIGNTHKFHYFVIHPTYENSCPKEVGTMDIPPNPKRPFKSEGHTKPIRCGKRKNHRGRCYNWDTKEFV